MVSMCVDGNGGIEWRIGYRSEKRGKVVVVCWEQLRRSISFQSSASQEPRQKKAAASQAWPLRRPEEQLAESPTPAALHQSA